MHAKELVLQLNITAKNPSIPKTNATEHSVSFCRIIGVTLSAMMLLTEEAVHIRIQLGIRFLFAVPSSHVITGGLTHRLYSLRRLYNLFLTRHNN